MTELFAKFLKQIVEEHFTRRNATNLAILVLFCFGVWLPSQYEYEGIIPEPNTDRRKVNGQYLVSDCRFPRQPTSMEKIFFFIRGIT
ncbi:hypothetical protein [Mesorhizobium sp. SP-1A]|uniref:hypothetical protein n=1 Tax=Mesorhizobium sp. SP-1A TaxID=3077840 RepID=UPI0028F723A7|nr:hypothetical protein [Mesorhizobium sp. SP-1A]